MNNHIESDDTHLSYWSRGRSYGVDYKEIAGGGVQRIGYCPWCGKKLPTDLGDELGAIIFDQLNLNSYSDPRVPAEYTSDLWWRNRQIPDDYVYVSKDSEEEQPAPNWDALLGDKKNSDRSYCCKEMQFHMEGNELHLSYFKKYHKYGIRHKKPFGNGVCLIDYCPWCGSNIST